MYYEVNLIRQRPPRSALRRLGYAVRVQKVANIQDVADSVT